MTVEETSDNESLDEPAAAGERVDALQARLDAAHAELEQARARADAEADRALRAAAEAENIRKRAERRIENAHKYALERLIADVLPAVDSFEQAIDAAAANQDGAAPALAEGVALSVKLLVGALERHGVAVVDPVGAPFDPQLHEAMTVVENDAAEPDSVTQVFQKGYTLNGRLVRAARVVVAKPSPSPSAPAPAPTPTASVESDPAPAALGENADAAANADNDEAHG